MKTMVMALMAVLLASTAVLAQEKSASKPEMAGPKPLMVSGRVRNDGKALMTDIDSEWMVSNAEALKGHEGKLVRVKCYVDTAHNRMQILTVREDDGTSNYTAARYADSAFRR